MKKWTKGLLACAFAGAMILTGCSSIAPVKNESEEILYQGGNVVSVGDYLFYSNGFASGVDSYSDTSDTEYNNAKKYSYLARMNKAEYDGELYANENSVDKIADKISGYSNSYMFVYGDYIYYATPNMHKTNENKYIWTYVTIMRCKLDGSDSKEIYTTKAYDASAAEIKAIKYNGKAYLMIYDGTNLTRIALGKSVDKSPISIEGVTSAAMPDENENFNGYIYYTVDRTSTVGQTGNIIKKLNIESGAIESFNVENGTTIKFVDRVENNIFYTITTNNSNIPTETYMIDANKSEEFYTSKVEKLFYSAEISDVKRIADGYALYEGFIFTTDSKVMYFNEHKAKSPTYFAELFIDEDDSYADTIVIDGANIYYSTSDSIMKKSVLDATYTSEEIITGYSFTAGYFGYDSRVDNIYFYAAEIVDEETEEESDGNYYMYGVSLQGKKEVTLYGKTL